MTKNRYLAAQEASITAGTTIRLESPTKLSISFLPDYLLTNILRHALPNPHTDLPGGNILNTARMIRKTCAFCPVPAFLSVNKRFHRVGKTLWLGEEFCHIYLNSWNSLEPSILRAADSMAYVVLTLDIRRGHRSLDEKLVPSAFGAKIRMLMQYMTGLEVLLVRVWHGIGSLRPVSEIILNNFYGVRVKKLCHIASQINTEDGVNKTRACPGLISEFYMKHFCSHLLRIPLDKVVEVISEYLDDSEPKLRVPIWRACAAARDGVDQTWLLSLPEKKSRVRGGVMEESQLDLELGNNDSVMEKKLARMPWIKYAIEPMVEKSASKKKQSTSKGKNIAKTKTTMEEEGDEGQGEKTKVKDPKTKENAFKKGKKDIC